MAIYYSRLSIVSRSRGHSAVSAAAYRAGVRLQDERTGLGHDYSKKKGVLTARMLAPQGASWALDLKDIWNRAEHAEVRRNARTARELVVALPAELSDAQNVQLAQQIGQDLVDRYGAAVLVAVHKPDSHGDDRNVHVHLLMSTRVAGPEGFGAKIRVLDDRTTGPQEAEAMRERVASRINAELELAGRTERVDARPLRFQADDAADRGDFEAVVTLSRTPTRHQGREVSAMARRGVASSVVTDNISVQKDNRSVHAWGSERAVRLKALADSRALKWVRQLERRVPASVQVSPRILSRAIGAVSAMTRVYGVDAELLNGQARIVEQSSRAARDAAQLYMEMIATELDRQSAALRSYFRSIGMQARERRQWTEASYVSPLLSQMLAQAMAAKRAYEAVVLASREKDRAQTTQTASASASAKQMQGDAPRLRPRSERLRRAPARGLTRREWAEHRRRQRAGDVAAQRNAASHAPHTATSHDVADAARRWRDAHDLLLRSLKTLRGEMPHPTRVGAPSTETRFDGDFDAIRQKIGIQLSDLAAEPKPAFRLTRKPAPS